MIPRKSLSKPAYFTPSLTVLAAIGFKLQNPEQYGLKSSSFGVFNPQSNQLYYGITLSTFFLTISWFWFFDWTSIPNGRSGDSNESILWERSCYSCLWLNPRWQWNHFSRLFSQSIVPPTSKSHHRFLIKAITRNNLWSSSSFPKQRRFVTRLDWNPNSNCWQSCSSSRVLYLSMPLTDSQRFGNKASRWFFSYDCHKCLSQRGTSSFSSYLFGQRHPRSSSHSLQGIPNHFLDMSALSHSSMPTSFGGIQRIGLCAFLWSKDFLFGRFRPFGVWLQSFDRGNSFFFFQHKESGSLFGVNQRERKTIEERRTRVDLLSHSKWRRGKLSLTCFSSLRLKPKLKVDIQLCRLSRVSRAWKDSKDLNKTSWRSWKKNSQRSSSPSFQMRKSR